MKREKYLYFYWLLQIFCIGFILANNFIMERLEQLSEQTFDITLSIIYENSSGLFFGVCICLLILMYQKMALPAAIKAGIASVLLCAIVTAFYLYTRMVSFHLCLLFGVGICLLVSAAFRLRQQNSKG